MMLAIPRGIIYHKVVEDLKWLLLSLLIRLDNDDLIIKFEKAFSNLVGRKNCVAFPFARTAIYFALKSRNFPNGAEIIMPPITIKAILDVVLQLELKPIFVDVNPDTLCFDADDVRQAISSDTRAILITYLYGIVPNVDSLIEVSREHNLFIVEDFSQCLNGKYNGKNIGSYGDVGVYSASSIKTLDTYGGGLLVCDDESMDLAMREAKSSLMPPIRKVLIKKIITDLVRNLATTRYIFTIFVFPLLRLLSHLNPNSVVKQLGERDSCMLNEIPLEWFSSFTSLQALAGLEFIERIQNEDLERVRNVNILKKGISSNVVSFPKGTDGGDNIYWQLIGYVSSSSNMQACTYKHGVDTARPSLMLIASLKSYPYHAHTPHASRLYNSGYFVPCYPGLSDFDLERIITGFNALPS